MCPLLGKRVEIICCLRAVAIPIFKTDLVFMWDYMTKKMSSFGVKCHIHATTSHNCLFKSGQFGRDGRQMRLTCLLS